MTTTTTKPELLLSGYYNLAYDAFRNTSFRPDKRAKSYVEGYSQELAEDLELIEKFNGDTERYKEGYIRRWTDWMSAKGRCISSMITGPANFPVRRAEKANQSEEKKGREFMDWREKVLAKITRPESTDIVKGTEGALDKMRAKLEKLRKLQAHMKEANKVVKSKKLSDEEKVHELKEMGETDQSAWTLLRPDFAGRVGYADYKLTNNGAVIRRVAKELESEITRLSKYADGNKEYKIGEVTVIENVEENRLQLFFEGKPVFAVRKELKSNGYRWSGKNECWQRQLTNNATYGLRYIKETLETVEYE